jgi:hypothetical protein
MTKTSWERMADEQERRGAFTRRVIVVGLLWLVAFGICALVVAGVPEPYSVLDISGGAKLLAVIGWGIFAACYAVWRIVVALKAPMKAMPLTPPCPEPDPRFNDRGPFRRP